MYLRKTYAVIGTGFMWCALMALAPQARAQQVGELSDNSASIIALCGCTNAEAASTSQCKALLASQSPEKQQSTSSDPSAAVHALMAPQGR
ncbi:MAG: hypothetical protein ABIR96_06700 [Bdellovibrionota bacterium]